jgi:hypothetical protein
MKWKSKNPVLNKSVMQLTLRLRGSELNSSSLG